MNPNLSNKPVQKARFFNLGAEITRNDAWVTLQMAAIDRDMAEIRAIWAKALQYGDAAEEARDTVFELSGCSLEIEVE